MRAFLLGLMVGVASGAAFTVAGRAGRAGRALLAFEPGIDSDTWGALIRLDGRAEKLVNAFGEIVPLAADLPVTFETCNRANAYYYLAPPKIVVCYEFMDLIYELHLPLASNPEHAIDNTIATTVGVLAHELGHAAVRLADLPIVARSEDVADAFAAWFTWKVLKDTEPAVGLGAFWRLLHLTGETGDANDVHSPSDVRAYNLLCWAYGAGEAPWLDEVLGDRARHCEGEFAEIDSGWRGLLGLGPIE